MIFLENENIEQYILKEELEKIKMIETSLILMDFKKIEKEEYLKYYARHSISYPMITFENVIKLQFRFKNSTFEIFFVLEDKEIDLIFVREVVIKSLMNDENLYRFYSVNEFLKFIFKLTNKENI